MQQYDIIGIAATDNEGYIAKENKQGKLMPILKNIENKDNEAIDYYYLRSVMMECILNYDGAVGVMGENTYEQMKTMNLVEQMADIITSDNNTMNLKTHVLNSIYSTMYRNMCVLILGGRSVYNTFINEYDTFYHIQYDSPIEKGQKSIRYLTDHLSKTHLKEYEKIMPENFTIVKYYK